MARAATDLQTAESRAASRQAPLHGVPHLAAAEQELGAAVASATQRAMASAISAGAGRSAPQAPDTAGVPGEPVAELDPALAKSWDGISATLLSSDQKTRKTQYSSYYRKANQRYLEDVARAARGWQNE
jgi:hypothetical protein